MKNALYLKKKARTVTHECQKVNSSWIFTFYCPIRERVKCYLLFWQILIALYGLEEVPSAKCVCEHTYSKHPRIRTNIFASQPELVLIFWVFSQ